MKGFKPFQSTTPFSLFNILSHRHDLLRFRFCSFSSVLFRTHHLNSHYLTCSFPYSSLLHSCNNLQALKRIHASLIVSSGFQPLSVASKLITLYSQLNDFRSAFSICNSFEEPNTVIWNSIIKSHVDSGLFGYALLQYGRMRELGVAHDSFTFPIINQAIWSLGCRVEYGETVHCVAMKMGFGQDVYFGNTMLEVYVKCGSIGNASKLFDEMTHRDLVSWTSIISGYIYGESFSRGFKLFNKMRMEMEPNSVTMVVMLQACSAFESVNEGRELHSYVIKKGFMVDRSVQNSILRMYTKTGGSGEEVETFFSEIEERDIISWNILIAFYSFRGDIAEVAERFNEMRREVTSSIESLTLVVSAIANCANLSEGGMLHCSAIKTGLHDTVLMTCLLALYAKCGALEISAQLFRDIPHRNSITWSSMMSGFTQNGFFKEAIELYQQMLASGLQPNHDIISTLVIAYTHLGALQLGKATHAFFIRNLSSWPEEDSAPLETSLLNMYIRCGSISSALICFNRVVVKDVVTWTSMIEGFGTHGLAFEALKFFKSMLESEVQPNSVTFLSLLSACSHSGLVREGCEVFHSMKWGFRIEPDLNHYTCMVDLLGRSGKLKEALTVILKLVTCPDSRIWGALLAASRVHEDKKLGEYAAEKLLELEPDNVGYYTLWSNIEASVERWGEVEEVRRVMHERDLKKKPGWSCIEVKGMIHGFVSGDTSHHQVEEICKVVGCLNRKIQEFGVSIV